MEGSNNTPAGTAQSTGMPVYLKIGLVVIFVGGLAAAGYFGYNKFIKVTPEGDAPKGDAGAAPEAKPEEKKEAAKEADYPNVLFSSKEQEEAANKKQPSASVDVKKTTPIKVNNPFGGTSASLGVSKKTVIMKGTKGLAAQSAQKALNKLGAKLIVDGNFGPLSETALKKITGKATITLGELDAFAKSKGQNNVFGITLY